MNPPLDDAGIRERQSSDWRVQVRIWKNNVAGRYRGVRAEKIRRRIPEISSYHVCDDQDNRDDQQQSDAAGRIISPAGAVGPRG